MTVEPVPPRRALRTAATGAVGVAPGSVALIGSGPGDPDLLTLRAARLLGSADVVLHDALVDPRVFDLVAEDAELIDVGKRKGRPLSQDLICNLLVALARDGRRVVRLKGGDPFVFGRGGEEALALARAGVPCTVVPGVSSAVAAPAAAGIPVTHRRLARSFTVVTGHTDADVGTDPCGHQGVDRDVRTDTDGPDWTALARTGGTLVILMGVTHRGRIAAALMEGGLDPDTPAAAVSAAATVDQTIRRCRLADLGRVEVQAPAVLVVGAVAALDVTAIDPAAASTDGGSDPLSALVSQVAV